MFFAQNRISGALVIGGAALATIGCFLPWISEVPPPIDTVTRDVFLSAQHAPLPGVDGMVITALALVSALLGVLLLTGHRQRSAVVAASLLAVIAGVTVVADYLDIDGSVQTLRSTYFFIAQVGPGVYLTAVGVVIWGIGALTNLWRSLQIPSHEVSTTG
jgi:hypothetical protein